MVSNLKLGVCAAFLLAMFVSGIARSEVVAFRFVAPDTAEVTNIRGTLWVNSESTLTGYDAGWSTYYYDWSPDVLFEIFAERDGEVFRFEFGSNVLQYDMASKTYFAGATQGFILQGGELVLDDPIVNFDLSRWESIVVYANGSREDPTKPEVFATLVSLGPSLAPRMAIEGGISQECQFFGGTRVNASLSYPIFGLVEGDSVAAVEWRFNGEHIGFGDSTSVDVPVGSHSIEVIVETALGDAGFAASPLSVVDTTPPDLTVRLLDRNGHEISMIRDKGNTSVRLEVLATDVCDPYPMAEIVGGAELVDGQLIRVSASQGLVSLEVDELTIHATAQDESGNRSVKVKTVGVSN